MHNDGAADFALAQAPLDASSHTQWEPVLEPEPGVRLLGVDAYASHVVVALRRSRRLERPGERWLPMIYVQRF